MDLWIRSQDKEHLLKVSTIYYQHGIAADYNGNEIEHFCVLGVCNSSHYELGIYKSKERALEVLDEIQNFITNNLKFDGNYEASDLYLKSIIAGSLVKVYKMPKE